MRAYNLFRRKADRHICCAVPEDCAVPGFVHGDRWEFGGRFDEAAVLPGFDPRAAAASARFNGFYVFAAIGRA